VKMRLERSAERDKRETKNIFSAEDAQSKAEGIQNRILLPDSSHPGRHSYGLGPAG